MKLTEDEFRAEYLARPGLIPIELDPVRRTAIWMDLGEYHCFEGSFRRSLAAYKTLLAGSLHSCEPWQCESSLQFLRSSPNLSRCLAPSGFIFHAGRCGSTLLAKILARSSEHMVFGEGGPHSQIWNLIASGSDPAALLLRNLMLHAGRRRLESHRAYIIKFTSREVVQLERIRTAFPEAPALFVFRHPAEILASYRRATPGWMGVETGVGKIWRDAETAVTDFFRQALAAGDFLQYLDYADLTPRILPAILRVFRLDPPQRDLEWMRAEFSWDSKSNRVWTARPTPEASPRVPSELLDLYGELKARRLRE